MAIFVISLLITFFLLAATVILFLGGEGAVEARLEEVSGGTATVAGDDSIETRRAGLGQIATAFTGYFQPVRALVSGSDENLQYRLALAGFRRPEHVEIFTAVKMLLPVVAIVIASYSGNLMIAIGIGVLAGFFLPDMALTYLVSQRQDKIRRSLPDAMDLLVICMEAGLGIDQGLVRVGDELELTAPALSEELQIITNEQRAGKPRLEAWRSFAERVDFPYERQFVAMLIQT